MASITLELPEYEAIIKERDKLRLDYANLSADLEDVVSDKKGIKILEKEVVNLDFGMKSQFYERYSKFFFDLSYKIRNSASSSGSKILEHGKEEFNTIFANMLTYFTRSYERTLEIIGVSQETELAVEKQTKIYQDTYDAQVILLAEKDKTIKEWRNRVAKEIKLRRKEIKETDFYHSVTNAKKQDTHDKELSLMMKKITDYENMLELYKEKYAELINDKDVVRLTGIIDKLNDELRIEKAKSWKTKFFEGKTKHNEISY